MRAVGNFWMTRTGWTGGGRADEGRTGGLWRVGGREADGRKGGRGAKERRTGGRADGQMRVDGARTGRTSGRADERMSKGFKWPCTSFPASLSSAQTTRLTTEQVCRALGSALGS